MNGQRIVGIVLVVVGVVLAVIGFISASDSVADQVSETFTGRFTDKTTWYIIGGIGVALLGLLMVVVRLGKGKD